jgi:DNA-binding CsgD family transcriptional regulator
MAGEAGVGKTALTRHFSDGQRTARVLYGACDPLFTPHPLGPLIDIADSAGGELKTVVEGGRMPREVALALVGELRRRKPSLLVIEDVHWADEATLDVLRLLGRRIDQVPAFVIVTYRDDALERSHPLWMVLGDLHGIEGIARMKVAPLSGAAVAELADPVGLDAAELHHKTGGNPFFVAEVLASGHQRIPDTVRDAILARAARLSDRARTLVEAVAAVPPQAELWLLHRLAPDAIDRVEECVGAGILVSRPGAVAFRHELARLTIEESTPADRTLALHQEAIAALSSPPSGELDPTRLSHHAEAALDRDAVLRFAPSAAERAMSFGAYREAAAQYARAIRFSSGVSREILANVLDRQAYALYLSGQFPDAIDAQQRALESYRAVKDALRTGDSLRSLSRLLRYVGRTAEAMVAAQEAVSILEPLPEGHELAMAYCNLSHLFMNSEDSDQTHHWGTRALEIAERLGDEEALVYARINFETLPDVERDLESTLKLAQEKGLDEHAGRVFVSLTWWSTRSKSYEVADRHFEAGLEYCTERGLDLWRHYLLAYRARREMDRGSWSEAVRYAELVIRDPLSPMPRIVALAVLGLVRARRGDPGYWSLLDEAAALAESTGELQRLEPAAMARAEAAWLEGRNEATVEATGVTYEIAIKRHSRWIVGEMASWRRRAGLDEVVPDGIPEPYALQLSGESLAAASAWADLGCPYEAAMALAESGEEEALRRALGEFQRLGARPAAAIVARRLREQGVLDLPRGPRPSTRQNKANLTAREAEILALIVEGLGNAEIAERLFLSERTVHGHVSAILRKLGVKTRLQAAAMQIR